MTSRIAVLSALLLILPLGRLASADAPEYIFYGLSMTNMGVTLVKKTHDKPAETVLSATTMSDPRLLGDPPNIVFNNSPLNFIALMLDDETVERLKQEASDYKKHSSDKLQMQLYVSAAGADAARKITLNQEVISKLKTSLRGSKRLNDRLGGDVVQALEDHRCFDSTNKAEFHLCAVRLVFSRLLDIEFPKGDSYIEQDIKVIPWMAKLLSEKHSLTSRFQYIVQATTLAQPYAKDFNALRNTEGWMDTAETAYQGGTLETGSIYQENLLDRYSAMQPSDLTLESFMRSNGTALDLVSLTYLSSLMHQGTKFVANDLELNIQGVLQRAQKHLMRNNFGELLLTLVSNPDMPAVSALPDKKNVRKPLLRPMKYLKRFADMVR